jgi:hypothetical protein
MGAVGRAGFLGVLVGLLVALVPWGTASAAGATEAAGAAGAVAPCTDPVVEKWLECWDERVQGNGPYVVTLNEKLSLVEPGRRQRTILKNRVQERRHQLVVEVPKGSRTGPGGTALLVLAGGRMVHPDATIDRVPAWAVDELREAGVCVPQLLCNLVTESGRDTQPLKGRKLIEDGLVADMSTHVEAIVPVSPDPGSTSRETSNPNPVPNPDPEASGYSTSTWTAFWMALLLGLLLLAFVIVIRRSRGPVAVGHRAPPGRPAVGHAHAPAAVRVEERTTRLRVAPTPRHGRQVGARPAHARTAVVRTELHPQGYVEVDRVLHRAVWAEPGRPPPAPGSLVDVTDTHEQDSDSDVLYAFPPTVARHAKGTPR